MQTDDAEKRFSWEDHLGNLSIQNKFFLMKILGITDQWQQLGFLGELFPSRDHNHAILASFNSTDVIENFLSLFREFGFLHFCSGVGNQGTSLEVLDILTRGFGRDESWWRGYSPYDDYSDDFAMLLDTLLIFQDDIRFSDHIGCLAKIFDIDQNVVYRDFNHMKDLKVSKRSMIVRRGEYFNGTLSVFFCDNANYSIPYHHQDIFIKVFTSVVESLKPEVSDISCGYHSRKDNFDILNDNELEVMIDEVLYNEFFLWPNLHNGRRGVVNSHAWGRAPRRPLTFNFVFRIFLVDQSF